MPYRYVIARNKWSALQTLKRVREIPSLEGKLLYVDEKLAMRSFQRKRLIDQAKFRIFKVPFNDTLPQSEDSITPAFQRQDYLPQRTPRVDTT